MRLILPSQFDTQPWRNGGGITHEIAREDGESRLLWRISIAEVSSDGPFSRFAGLSRVLTVIEGAGLTLAGPECRLDALPFSPLAFSGDLPVESHMIDGPVRDFNVIYDAERLSVSVHVIKNTLPECSASLDQFYALLAIEGTMRLGAIDLPNGALALGEHFPTKDCPDFLGLLVDFKHKR